MCWQVVRAMLWPDGWAQQYVTAGDDGAIVLWQNASSGTSAPQPEPESTSRSKKRQRWR